MDKSSAPFRLVLPIGVVALAYIAYWLRVESPLDVMITRCPSAWFATLCGCMLVGAAPRKNVLFIVSDDFRPQISALSGPDFPSPVHPPMWTPNLDHLASRSLVLTRAYVQQATCSPSRASFLTSRRPDTTRVWDLHTYFRKSGGNFTTLPQYFKQHGYESLGMGKIFHPGEASGGDDDAISWTKPYYHPPNKRHWSGKKRSWYAVPNQERLQKPLPDEQNMMNALHHLRLLAPQAKTGVKPFFMAVGFFKPHLPFNCPEEFYRHYPHDQVRLPPNPRAPRDMPNIAWSNYGELRTFHDVAGTGASGAINTTLPDALTRDLRRAYYSCVSYIDYLVGMLLHELTVLGLEDSTVVSFLGDHGWHLGENGEWTKHTNFEQAVHAPLMVRIPGVTDHGVKSREPVEFVDVYPTIVEAAGLPQVPPCPEDSRHIEACTEGRSLVPLVSAEHAPWKGFAISQWRRQGHMGYTIRTDRYRYTEWAKWNRHTFRPMWGMLAGVELYDHNRDPEENHNVADEEAYASTRSQLSLQLHQTV